MSNLKTHQRPSISVWRGRKVIHDGSSWEGWGYQVESGVEGSFDTASNTKEGCDTFVRLSRPYDGLGERDLKLGRQWLSGVVNRRTDLSRPLGIEAVAAISLHTDHPTLANARVCIHMRCLADRHDVLW